MTATIDKPREILPRTGPDAVGGYSDHGPMVAEALVAQGPPDSAIPWEDEMGLPSHGQATVWGTPVGHDRAREGAGWRQRLRQWWAARLSARRWAVLEALSHRWDPQGETVRPLRAEAAPEMVAAHASLSVATMLYGLY